MSPTATIPELAPVVEYYGGANTTDNYHSFSGSSATSSPLPNTVVGYTTPSKKRSSSSAAPPQQLSPLNTALPPLLTAYPMYPGLQTAKNNSTTTTIMFSTTTTTGTAPSTAPVTTNTGRRGQEPRSLNRPRKISTAHTRDSSSASTSSPQQTYQQQQHYVAPYQSPTSRSPISVIPPKQPDELFRTLPGEVLAAILEQLQALHLAPDSPSCATCWARDLCSLSLASRAWSAAAQLSLYRDVCLVGADSAAHRKRFGKRASAGGRMTLLRRTLRANDKLAATVRSLRVPAPVGESCDGTPNKANGGLSQKDVYQNAVAALVMACPNLEVLAGPVATHTHDAFSRITHALSTRTHLKTINWRIGASGSHAASSSKDLTRPGSSARRSANVFSSALAAMLPPALTAAQETRFLEHHRSWPSLASLSIHCLPNASLAPATLLQRTLTRLPALQHLHLCRVPANAFHDAALLALPPLASLTLSHIPGISSAGLSAFATRPNSQRLRRLQLRHAPLTSLPALARLLSHLPQLVDFALVQDFAPLMPSDDDAFALWMMPYLASRTLVRLHWDVMTHHHRTGVSDADDILARSIAAGGFPALRTLRAPSDPEGVFQQLCRPLESIATSADRIWANGGRCGSSQGQHTARSSMDSGFAKPGGGGLPKSATAASLPSSFTAPPPHATDLRAARIAAQARLDDARPRFRFHVQVHSEDGLLVDDFGLAGYVGTVGSPIRYCLQADPGSSDARGGLVDVPDLAAPGGEALVGEDDDDGPSVGGCTGSWNWREGVVADRKEKEPWWHTERGRWVRPRLD